jgi:hypothetical protein
VRLIVQFSIRTMACTNMSFGMLAAEELEFAIRFDVVQIISRLGCKVTLVQM